MGHFMIICEKYGKSKARKKMKSNLTEALLMQKTKKIFVENLLEEIN